MSLKLQLPNHHGNLATYQLIGQPYDKAQTAPKFNRVAFAAAHIVTQPLNDHNPWQNAAIDWDSTLAFRHHLWQHGFKIAEAMDTAQRSMGLNWQNAQELIKRSLLAAKSHDHADLACGAGSDHLDLNTITSLDDVIHGYEEQFQFIESHGGRAIMMASRALAKIARSADDYRKVYSHVLSQASNKVILHWLGDMFDPQLRGYWGSSDFNQALQTVIAIINDNRDKIDGIKISLLDDEKEIALRQLLPPHVMCYTGDDFNFAPMIKEKNGFHSHALLGIFDAIAPQASAALTALARGDEDKFDAILAPCVALSRKIFAAPTQYYKAGIVFLAWLNNHQNHFTMPMGMQSARSILHYVDIFKLADHANVLDQPDLAIKRMQQLLAVYGLAN